MDTRRRKTSMVIVAIVLGSLVVALAGASLGHGLGGLFGGFAGAMAWYLCFAFVRSQSEKKRRDER